MDNSIRTTLFSCFIRTMVKQGGIVCFIVLLAACSQSMSDPQLLLQKAKQHHTDRDFNSAVIQLKILLSENPKVAEGRYLLGRVYLDMGDLQRAESELKKAHELDKESPRNRVGLAAAWLQLRKFKDLENLLSLRASWSDEFLMAADLILAQSKVYQGNIQAAEKLHASAALIDAKATDVLFTQALIDSHRDEIETSKKTLKTVLLKNPNHIGAVFLNANIAYFEKSYTAARASFEKSIALQPLNINSKVGLARSLIGESKFDQANAELKTLLENVPYSPVVNALLASLAFQKRDYENVLLYTDKVFINDSTNMQSHYISAVSAYQLNQFEKSYGHILKVASKKSSDPQIQKLLAATQMKLGLIDESAKVLASIDESDFEPSDASLLAAVGKALRNDGEYEQGRVFIKLANQLDSAEGLNDEWDTLLDDLEESSIQELVAAVDKSPDSVTAQMELVLGYLKIGQADKALEQALMIQKKQPKSALGFTLAGMAQAKKSNFDSARSAFSRALELQPDDPNAWNNLAVLAINDEEPEKAHRFYEGVLVANPGNLTALLGLFELDRRSGAENRAVTWLDRAVKLNSKALQPHLMRAHLYLTQNQPLQALAVLQEIQQVHPNAPLLLTKLGQAQKLSGLRDSAIKTLTQATEVSPDDIVAHYELADMYENIGQLTLADKFIKKALAINSNHLVCKLIDGRIKLKSGDLASAQLRLQEFKKQRVDHVLVLEFEAQIALVSGRYAEAVSLYRDVLELRETGPITLQLSQALWNNHQKADAIQALTQWLERYPEDMLARNSLANFYLLNKEYDNAAAAFSDVIQRTPNNFWAQNNLAWILHENGDVEGAVVYAQNAHRLRPENPYVMDTLGMIYLDLGRVQTAQQMVADAAVQLPEDLDIQYHLAKVSVAAGQVTKAELILGRLIEASSDNAVQFTSRTAAERLLHELK